jgi:hypothetical protein
VYQSETAVAVIAAAPGKTLPPSKTSPEAINPEPLVKRIDATKV